MKTHLTCEDVELGRRYSNRSGLLNDLTRTKDQVNKERHTEATSDGPITLKSACGSSRPRLIANRISPDDLQAMLSAFRSGAPAHLLAKQYGIGETNIKRLIRENGARRKDTK